MTASLYARINALAAEVRSLKQDNERLRRHNAELSSELSGARKNQGLPSPFAVFERTWLDDMRASQVIGWGEL
jgi:hypothetical protein